MAIVEDGTVDNSEIYMLCRTLRQFKELKPGRMADLNALIERICADGVVTSEERKQLLLFLQKFVDEKTSAEKGAIFEEYVIKCFDPNCYRIIEWRSDKYIPDWGFPISSSWPDLVMESIASEKRVAIECKFRSYPRNGCVEWADERKIRNYREYEQKEGLPVYVALGLGGEPDAPRGFYISRLRNFRNPVISLDELSHFRVKGDTVELGA